MIMAIILGVIGLFVTCCFWVVIEEEVKRWKQRKQP